MTGIPSLVTVEQFRQLPKGGPYQCELQHGEVIALARPKSRDWKLQHELMMLLRPKLAAFGEVGMEVPYRPLPEFELRAADVAAISRARFDATDPDDNLHGAPELVIEVKSPSNSVRQLRELASYCLNRGAIEFWIVDIDNKSVTVMSHEGFAQVFRAGDTLSLAAFASDDLPVDDIFA